MEAAVQQIIDAEGRIDVLINNAGYGSYGAIEDVPIDEARRQFEETSSASRATPAGAAAYARTGSGRILNISSMAGVLPRPWAWYHATGYALEAFSDALRMEVEEFGIDVVIIRPAASKKPLGLIGGRPPRGILPNGVYAAQRSGFRQICVCTRPSSNLCQSPRLSLTLFCEPWRRAAPRPATWWVSVLSLPCCHHTVLRTRLFDGWRRILPRTNSRRLEH